MKTIFTLLILTSCVAADDFEQARQAAKQAEATRIAAQHSIGQAELRHQENLNKLEEAKLILKNELTEVSFALLDNDQAVLQKQTTQPVVKEEKVEKVSILPDILTYDQVYYQSQQTGRGVIVCKGNDPILRLRSERLAEQTNSYLVYPDWSDQRFSPGITEYITIRNGNNYDLILKQRPINISVNMLRPSRSVSASC